jgi:hypothetical protein
VWGHVTLVPRADAELARPQAYADRSLRNAKLVDYDHPGFVVIYTGEDGAPGEDVSLALKPIGRGVRLLPSHAVVSAGGTLTLRNQDSVDHVFSIPSLGLLATVRARASIAVPVQRAGPHEVFVLDAPGALAVVFAAPGRYAVVSRSGRWELVGLAPGQRVVRAWHPRFPPLERKVELSPDTVIQLDFRLGVDTLEQITDEERGKVTP